jgi:hypothetical protein
MNEATNVPSNPSNETLGKAHRERSIIQRGRCRQSRGEHPQRVHLLEFEKLFFPHWLSDLTVNSLMERPKIVKVMGAAFVEFIGCAELSRS